MSDATTRRNPLKWEGNYFTRAPVWPREPDLAVIKRLAMEHLASELPSAFNGAEPNISDFAYGAFNKLYLVSYNGHDVSYLFRATLPVIPFYKTESEVATLAYLRAETSIPVPRAIAWNSSANNDLGFEWILMDKVAGVELRSVWRHIPWERKLELMDELAGFIDQLRAHTFSAIGSLYFKSALESRQVGRNYETIDALFEDPTTEDGLADSNTRLKSERNAVTIPSTLHPVDIATQSAPEKIENAEYVSSSSWIPTPKIQGQAQGSDCGNAEAQECGNGFPPVQFQGGDEFVIGPIFSWIFWKGSRLYVPGNRGPYQSCSEWYRALIEMQISWVKAVREEDDSDYDSDFEKESPDTLEWCQQYLDVLTAICPEQEEHSASSLHHHDLNEANILVNPETFGITGIVDWETINIVPNWRVTDYPEFIDSCDPPSDTEPEIPVYNGGRTLETDTRDQWDNRILRGQFDQAMKRLSASYDSPLSSKSRETKRAFETEIGNLTDWLKRSQNWLKRYKDAINVEKKIEEKRGELDDNGVGTGHASMEEDFAVERDGFNNVAHDVLKTDITAQTPEQAMPTTFASESQLVNGAISENDIHSNQITKEKDHSLASDTTIPSSSSTSLENSTHIVALDRPYLSASDSGEKLSRRGSRSGSKDLQESHMQLTEVNAKMEVTSSNVSEVGTDYTAPTEKSAAMDEEWYVSSNTSDSETDHTKATDKTAKMDDDLPTSSNISEAGSDRAPLATDGEDFWKGYCKLS